MKVRINNQAPVDPPNNQVPVDPPKNQAPVDPKKNKGEEAKQPTYDVNRVFGGDAVDLSKTEEVTLEYATKLLGGADYSNFIQTGYRGVHLVALSALQENGLKTGIKFNDAGGIDQVTFDANNPLHQEHLYGNLAALVEMVRTEPDEDNRKIYMDRLNENISWIMDPSMRQNLTLQMATDPSSPTGKVVNLVNNVDEQRLGYYKSGADSRDRRGHQFGLMPMANKFITYGGNRSTGNGNVIYDPTANFFSYNKVYDRIDGSEAKKRGYPVEVHHVREHPTDPSKNREVYKPVPMSDMMDWHYDNGRYGVETLMNHLASHGSVSMYGELGPEVSTWLQLPKEHHYNGQYWSDNIISPYIIYDKWMDKFNANRLDRGRPIIPQKGLERVANPRLKTN